MNQAQAQIHNEQHLVEVRRAPALAAMRAGPRVRVISPPAWAKPDTQTASRAKGYAYEKRVKKELQNVCEKEGWILHDHQWFEYKNGNEVKFFQPDFIIERPNDVGIVIEVKLTYVDTAAQLSRYVEYLKIFGLICIPLTIVKNLIPGVPSVIHEFAAITPGGVYHLWI